MSVDIENETKTTTKLILYVVVIVVVVHRRRCWGHGDGGGVRRRRLARGRPSGLRARLQGTRGERGSACSDFFSQEVQKACQFGLLTFWLEIVPSPFYCIKKRLLSLHTAPYTRSPCSSRWTATGSVGGRALSTRPKAQAS